MVVLTMGISLVTGRKARLSLWSLRVVAIAEEKVSSKRMSLEI